MAVPQKENDFCSPLTFPCFGHEGRRALFPRDLHHHLKVFHLHPLLTFFLEVSSAFLKVSFSDALLQNQTFASSHLVCSPPAVLVLRHFASLVCTSINRPVSLFITNFVFKTLVIFDRYHCATSYMFSGQFCICHQLTSLSFLCNKKLLISL